MTTKFMYERDITGAPGNILPFGEIVLSAEISAAETVSITIPSECYGYVAVFSSYPKQAVANNIAIRWNYYPSSSMEPSADAPFFVSTGERVGKYVNGDSRIDALKVRANLSTPITESPVVINITLFSVDPR
jgi:hypothetical protein